MNFQKFRTRFVFLILLSSIFSISIFAQTKKRAEPAVKPLPNLVLNTIDGKKWELYENRGNIVLLNFWATWCVPCRTEIPALVRLAEKHRADGLTVAGISVDSENPVRIEEFIEMYKIEYPILLTVSGSLLSRQKAIPMSLLIDENGFLAKKYIGAIKEDVFEKDIKDLQNKKSARQKGLQSAATKVSAQPIKN